MLSYSPSATTEDAYLRGTQDAARPGIGVLVGRPGEPYAPTNMRLVEIREAIADWRRAASDHGHASFYGVDHIRAMRAYWLGRARAYRRDES